MTMTNGFEVLGRSGTRWVIVGGAYLYFYTSKVQPSRYLPSEWPASSFSASEGSPSPSTSLCALQDLSIEGP
jgi:hypothetical protein